ncbi:MAG: glucosaminidase domain-containing protein [Patescibacteria group bacterium]|nr:glucosaminidase domain-containing protein [Patescibacteria group bacterium]
MPGNDPLIPQEVIAAAEECQVKWHVPASVTIAQWALESGWGKHMPPGSNNPFGIKAETDQPSVKCYTREYRNGEWVRVPAYFRKYTSLADAFDEHGEFLADNHRYAAAFSTSSGPDFANAIAAAGYATDPHYGNELCEIIVAHNLTQYDTITPTLP